MTGQVASAEERTGKLQGLGVARKRVEDVRFVQGKGNYVDDIKLPGMLFGDFVRSPYGHARIISIDKEAALAVPGVKAILTVEDLKPLDLAWMPTLAGDVQMVLADGKGLHQGEGVAVGGAAGARRGLRRGGAGRVPARETAGFRGDPAYATARFRQRGSAAHDRAGGVGRSDLFGMRRWRADQPRRCRGHRRGRRVPRPEPGGVPRRDRRNGRGATSPDGPG